MLEKIAKLRRKPVIVGLLSLAVVALLAALAVPSMTALAAGTGGNPPNQNIAHVQGTVSGTITITPTSGNSVGPLAFNGSYTVIYNSQTSVAERVTLNIAKPTTGTGGNPPNQNIAHVQGTASGSITIAPTSGNSVGPLAFSGSYTVIYNSQTSVAERVMLNMPRQTPGPGGNLPNHNFKIVRGTIQGISSDNTTMTISLTDGPGSLAQGQTVIIMPGPASGKAGPGANFGGYFRHHGSGGSSGK
jgi:hypothetical protein